jgi:hypothetical protein
MSYALFITRNDIIKNTPLQGAIDADALLPFVRVSQDKYLKNLLGTVLFDFLQDRITADTVSSLSSFYQDLLEPQMLNSLSLRIRRNRLMVLLLELHINKSWIGMVKEEQWFQILISKLVRIN